MKTYVLTLSQAFPAKHPRRGEPTNFRSAFNNAQMCFKCRGKKRAMCMSECIDGFRKVHTIRANYPLWEKRISEVQDGRAVLSVRQWSGKPYCSPQIEIARLTSDDGVGIQMLQQSSIDPSLWFYDTGEETLFFRGREGLENIAYNDGLSLQDWLEWFKDYDTTQPLAIIHFTGFRYGTK